MTWDSLYGEDQFHVALGIHHLLDSQEASLCI